MSREAPVARTRVLRGAAADALRGATIGADLSLIAGSIATLDPVAAAAEAAVTANAAREDAARVGYEDGFQAGLRDAAVEAAARAEHTQAALNNALAALDAAAAELAARQAGTVADMEARITTIALQIAEAVVGREIAMSSAAGRDAIARALQLAPGRAAATARLNPQDVEAVGDLSTLTQRPVTVVADPSVESGGCVLDVGPCRIDAQITPALARVREVLGA